MTPADPYLWLEDVSGARAMDWVKAENAKSLGVLEKDSRFAGLLADALTIVQAKDRIPAPEFLAGQVYNFWQDSDHVHGVWRKTSLSDYARPEPAWITALDVDALSKAEKANWVWKGADCEWRAERRCMIDLSDGGEDAVTVREFDLRKGSSSRGGFMLPPRQAKRRLGRPRHPAGVARMGAGRADHLGLSVRGQADWTRPAAVGGDGGVPG